MHCARPKDSLVAIDLSCPACGSNRIDFNQAVSDACEVSCEECGRALGTFGELKAMVAAQVGGHD